MFCPLNWGLGHATRCVPLLHYYAAKGYQIMVAADGVAYRYFQNDFPDVQLIHLKGFDVKYPPQDASPLKWIWAILPGFVKSIFSEHRELKNILREHSIDIIISDNRYGVWNRKTYNVILTHQLNVISPLKIPFADAFSRFISRILVSRFHECWIPDFEGNQNLSGKLSHGLKLPKQAKFIGPLSRFSIINEEVSSEKYELLILLSGPEPQRSIFEKTLLEQLKLNPIKTLIVRGLPGNNETIALPSHIRMISHLPTPLLKAALMNSCLVICRSGYSSVMDLFCLKKKAVLVPTPGQTEQEYLAEKLLNEGVFYSISQQNFSLEEAMNKAIDFPDKKYPQINEQSYRFQYEQI
ncbi:MAG: glycosyltransferase [Bacteroidota bacterium]